MSSVNDQKKDDKQKQEPKEEKKKLSGAKGILHVLFVKKWHPQPTVNTTIQIFAIVGVLFIILGIVISIFNSTIIEIEQDNYQDEKKCKPIDGQDGYCSLSITVSESDMEPPIYVFYTLTNFYQNHRRYMKSKSTSQLSGNIISESDAKSACDPIIYNEDLQLPELINYEGEPLEKKGIANPCGLIAKSFFTDEYALYKNDNLETDRIPINEKGISWPEDKGKKFKQPSSNADKSLQWIDPENEHFIVWMRTSGLPNFRKLWGKIEQKLEKGETYYMKIQNSYDVENFNGQKGIVLSTAGPLGGKNQFLSAAFIVVGIICLVIALIFLFKKKVTHNNFGEAKTKAS